METETETETRRQKDAVTDENPDEPFTHRPVVVAKLPWKLASSAATSSSFFSSSSASSLSYENSKIFCNNCGEKGHVYNACKNPIMSISVIVFRFRVDPDTGDRTPEYLMIRRQNTLGFIDFVRGKYNVYNKNYIMHMLRQMTLREKEMLVETNFKVIWDSIWNDPGWKSSGNNAEEEEENEEENEEDNRENRDMDRVLDGKAATAGETRDRDQPHGLQERRSVGEQEEEKKEEGEGRDALSPVAPGVKEKERPNSDVSWRCSSSSLATESSSSSSTAVSKNAQLRNIWEESSALSSTMCADGFHYPSYHRRRNHNKCKTQRRGGGGGGGGGGYHIHPYQQHPHFPHQPPPHFHLHENNTNEPHQYHKTKKYRNEEIQSQLKFCSLRSGVATSQLHSSIPPNTATSTANDKECSSSVDSSDASSCYDLLALLKESRDIHPVWTEAEWGFPKGRRERGECDYNCAIREFSEETGYPFHLLCKIRNISAYNEIFTGSNYKSYKHKYYLMYMSFEDSAALGNTVFRSNNEISSLRWKNYEDCMDSIRYYNIEKKEVLTQIHRTVQNAKLFEFFCPPKSF